MKEQQDEAAKKVSEALSEQPKAAKKTAKNVYFYLPFGMKIKKESPNNIIMNRGRQNYLLFYNQKEAETSKEVYKISKLNKRLLVDKTFSSNKRFGYLLISKVKKDLYEVIVGVGGIKMTTETSMKNIASDSEKMAKVVSSVKYKSTK
ncbi:hypothetical protein [Heyndrickxia camelliae]|uniref:hypothetical protein n=1 Tax=Heyndrickxia camelliae TaxID=1707093 RepID=UPI0010545CAE|nr:hypothetical protein [Heyndrickxia camelliae]